jgi:hypothetical protein
MAKVKYSLAQLAESPTLPCQRCEGGVIPARDIGDLHFKAKPCPYCDGVGTFTLPVTTDLVAKVRGRKPGTLRSRRPDDARAYYVWRLARFHGGQDVTMPMQATFEVTGDPYVPFLDVVAEEVAQAVYGTDMAGSLRWAHAMGHEVSDSYINGSQIVPPSALPGGPVVLDNHKPDTEQLELV